MRRKRDRGVVGGEVAIKRFVAFFAGVRVDRVVMVGGVHVLAGAARTGDEAEVGREVRQRGERGERYARRTTRRQAEDGRSADGERMRRCGDGDAAGSAASGSEGAGGPGDDGASDGSEEFGGARGAGNWGAGGLGDRTGVG